PKKCKERSAFNATSTLSASVLSLDDDFEEDTLLSPPTQLLTPPMQPSAPTGHENDEDIGRTRLPCSELQLLSDKLKHEFHYPSDVAGGLLSYTAKRRRSIDKFIDGAADADAKASSDMMTLFLLMDERAAKREESRIERQEKYDREREVREARREEMHLLLMSKMLGHNQ
ncbi:hypothetical protein AaE_008490, partial [Aphanomyces astaci]